MGPRSVNRGSGAGSFGLDKPLAAHG
jgi:hypothetical protein